MRTPLSEWRVIRPKLPRTGARVHSGFIASAPPRSAVLTNRMDFPNAEDWTCPSHLEL